MTPAPLTQPDRRVSWHGRESAERAALHAPGITRVDNRIEVVRPEESGD